MKSTTPQKKIKQVTVTVEYWDCGDESHNHKSLETASACMIKKGNKSKEKITNNVWDDNSYREVLKKYRNGFSFSDIAKEYCVSRSRAAQIIKSAERAERRSEDDNNINNCLAGLNPRIRNAIVQHFFFENKMNVSVITIDDVRRLFESGNINSVVNLGEKGRDKLFEWLNKQ